MKTITRVEWRPIYKAHKWDWSKSVEVTNPFTGQTTIETTCDCCPEDRKVTLQELVDK